MRRILLIIALALSPLVQFLPVPTASAAGCPAGYDTVSPPTSPSMPINAFFHEQTHTCVLNEVMIGGVLYGGTKYACNSNCTTTFIDEIESAYEGTEYASGAALPGTTHGYDGFNSNINRVGAAYIVLDFLDGTPNGPNNRTVTGTPSILGAPSGQWLQFEQRVQEYVNDNLVNWNDTLLFGPPSTNTAYSSGRAPNDGYNDDVAFTQPSCAGLWAQYCGPQNVISFQVPLASGGTTAFYIRKECANPLADIAPVPPINPNANCDVALTQIPQGGGGSVEAGAPFVAKIVMDNPVGLNTTWNSSYGLNFPGSPGTPIGVSGNIPPGNSNTFFVPLTAQSTAGVQTFTWQMEQGGTAFGQSCTGSVNVYQFVAPYLSTSGGDVQAGGAVGSLDCNATPGTGSIQGDVQSKAQYIVSANGSITDFGSANVAPNMATPSSPDDTLTFGDNSGDGTYGSICRPNLVTAVTGYARANPTKTISIAAPVSGTSQLQIQGNFLVDLDTGQKWDMTTFNNLGEVIDVSGNVDLTSSTGSATIQGRWTLYASGTITIDTNLTYASTSFANLPSLGIIAGQDIDITHNTTHIDGFLFANTTLNTCSDIQASGTSCNNSLTVNGMMMANNFDLYRTSNAANAGTLSEWITFVGQMFADTPPGFSDVIVPTANHSQFTGEQPPLY